MSNSVKPMRVARRMPGVFCIAFVLLTCCAFSVRTLSAQNNNEGHRVRNIVRLSFGPHLEAEGGCRFD
jgi:hypothetical protein